jgi:hypothetical protein
MESHFNIFHYFEFKEDINKLTQKEKIIKEQKKELKTNIGIGISKIIYEVLSKYPGIRDIEINLYKYTVGNKITFELDFDELNIDYARYDFRCLDLTFQFKPQLKEFKLFLGNGYRRNPKDKYRIALYYDDFKQFSIPFLKELSQLLTKEFFLNEYKYVEKFTVITNNK